MKKILTVVLASVMAVGLAACSGAPAKEESKASDTSSASSASVEASTAESSAASSESTAEVPAAGGSYKIGMNTWFQGVYALDALTNSAQEVIDLVGNESMLYNDEANVEKIVNDLENMTSVGVDGILWLGMFDNNFSVGPQIANDAQTYFAFQDKEPSDQTVIDNIRNMEYFAGGVGGDDYSAGIVMAQQALDEGCKGALIAGAEVGDPSTDARVKGFTETFEAGGGKVLDVARVSSGEANGTQTACDNMLAAHPDADSFFCTGQDFVLGAISTAGKQSGSDVKVYGCDINPELLEYLKSGDLAGCCGGHWSAGMYAAILLQNALDGKVMVDEDGLPPMSKEIPFIAVSAEQADLYDKFFCQEFPYEEDEIKSMLYRYNPDITYEEIRDNMIKYSFEDRMAAKLEAGKVTADELAAVGIELD